MHLGILFVGTAAHDLDGAVATVRGTTLRRTRRRCGNQTRDVRMTDNPARLREFRVSVPDATIDRIIGRVRQYQFPPSPIDEGDAWSYGVNSAWLRGLCEYWTGGYDWRAAEARLNRYPQYLVDLDGVDLHFVKVYGESGGSRPLLLLHGWPGSHYEFWDLVDRLTFPSRHGGTSGDAFDIVLPSLPGYGFSGSPSRPVGPRTAAHLMNRLMVDVLGFETYMVQGGDWGAVVGAWMGCDYIEHCAALHLNMIGWRPTPEDTGAGDLGEEQSIRKAMTAERPRLAYAVQQAAHPQTLGLALHDSPVGAAAWILDRFHDWTDLTDRTIDQVYSRDTLLTNVMIYLVTGHIATSLWAYRGNAEERAVFSDGIRCKTPTAVARFPYEYIASTPPRSWVERYFNLVRWTEMPSGGHFAALERPDLLLSDLQAFARQAYAPPR